MLYDILYKAAQLTWFPEEQETYRTRPNLTDPNPQGEAAQAMREEKAQIQAGQGDRQMQEQAQQVGQEAAAQPVLDPIDQENEQLQKQVNNAQLKLQLRDTAEQLKSPGSKEQAKNGKSNR